MKRFYVFLLAAVCAIGIIHADNLSDDSANQTIPFSHFAWGADLASSIDMTGQNLTSIDMSGCFGYKSSYIRFIGVGASIKMMVSNSSRSYPIYMMFRSSFTEKPSLLFLDMKAGYAFTDLQNASNQQGFYGSVGLGITLAKGKTFSSHIIAAYEILPLNDVTIGENTYQLRALQSASIKLGVNF